MKPNNTFIVRTALVSDKSTYRDIEIEASKSLYKLAEAIVKSFGFDFDHAFGFYSGLTPAKLLREHPKYELFADMGEADPDILSVKKTSVSQAFPMIGHTMIFLFDYGDDWRFRVSLKETGAKLAKVRYPRVVAKLGDAPLQYPDLEDPEESSPGDGLDSLTGKKSRVGR